MTRKCIGYDGHECEVSLEGAHDLRKRCSECKQAQHRVYARNLKRRQAKKRSESRPPRTCLDCDYDLSSFHPSRLRCDPCKAIRKRLIEVNRRAEVKRRKAEKQVKAIEEVKKVNFVIKKKPMKPAAIAALREAKKEEQYGRHVRAMELRNYAELIETGRI